MPSPRVKALGLAPYFQVFPPAPSYFLFLAGRREWPGVTFSGTAGSCNYLFDLR